MKNKKTVRKAGYLITPVSVGRPALLVCGNETIQTSVVAALLKATKERIIFETQNTVYDVVLSNPVEQSHAALSAGGSL